MASEEVKDISDSLATGSLEQQKTAQDSGSSDRATRDTAASSRQTPSRSISPRLTRSATAPILPSTQSISSSPLHSREASPSRTLQTAAKFGTTRVVRSRKNSSEQSPQRTPNHTPTIPQQNVPSAAVVQRALVAAGNQKLTSPTTASFAGEAQEPRKLPRASNIPTTQTPSRLKSPPSTSRTSTPSSKSQDSQHSPSTSGSHNNVKPPPSIQTIQEEDDDEGTQEADANLSGRGLNISGALDMIQDGQPHSNITESSVKIPARPSTIQEDPDEDNPEMTSSQTTDGTRSSKATAESGSGSEGANGRKDMDKDKEKERERPLESQRSAPASVAASRKPSITQLAPTKPAALQTRRSFQHLNPARNKVQSEGSVKSMTVETETVSNPDLLADDREGRGTSGRLDGAGSVRAKASTETIRPRKDRRRVRKHANIGSGTASSKADIFEAKVANAVDEAANSSGSDETFVYDSNPPEPRSSHHPPRYHHSRTPSTASMKSQPTDPRMRGQHFGVSGKKSMKFTNSQQFRDGDDDEGASTYSSNTARSSHRHHHHIARRLQNASQDSDSPVSGGPARSPRVRPFATWRGHNMRPMQSRDQVVPSLGDKSGSSNLYDLSGAAEADDEYTPLLAPSIRSIRADPRRRGYRYSRAEYYRQSPIRSCMRAMKFSCITILVTLAIGLVISGMVFCNRKLQDVHVKETRNILVSEQELFLEIEVHALNPNIVDISISEGSLDIFAKSKYVGTTEMWRDGTIPGIGDETEHTESGKSLRITGGVDEGTDPIEEPGAGTHTMLLGRVHELDSPLVFDSSPLKEKYSSSTAGLRLARPGNKTEEGGSRRWENVMQHPFELLVRGGLKYQLPLSSKEHSVTVIASAKVKPDKPSDGDDNEGDGKPDKDPYRNSTLGIGVRRGKKTFWA